MVASAPQAQPYFTASFRDFRCNSENAIPPMNASPAPVVSTGFTGNDGTYFLPDLLTISAPLLPSVTITFAAPRLSNVCAADSQGGLV